MSDHALAINFDQIRGDLKAWNISAASKRLRGKPKAAKALEHAILQGRLDLMRSDFDAVIKALIPKVSAFPKAYEARVVLGRALRALGRNADAFRVLDVMATDYTNDEVSTAEDLMWLGIGLHLTDYPKNAVTVLEEALQARGGGTEARVHLANLFVSKSNFRDSDNLYAEVIKSEPGHIGALLGAARIDIESDRNYLEARTKGLKILKSSPECVPAHNLLAELDLLGEQPLDAIKRLQEKSLRLAPNNPRALTLLGAAYLILDDDPRYEQTRKRALALNPRFAAFFAVVAEHAARVHRYRRALALNQEALTLDPEYWPALSNLGIGYSRLGDDDKAKEKLEEAFEGDSYNVRTYNLLTFFYDKVIKEFDWIDVKPMRLRVHHREKKILNRYVPPLLKEAYAYLKKKYAFAPQTPLHVEVFPDKELFSVRSTGLPRLGAHGICFGHVITSRSPSEGNYNWAEVLWHELSHVFHIQLSKSRVPRWFTEGLAVYESTEGRDEWRREMDPTLLRYKKEGRLRGIANFNLSFTQAKSFEDILVAYYHAYVVAEFMVERFGSGVVRDLLIGWGKKKKTKTVFADVLKLSLKEFDAAFEGWLETRLSHLEKNFEIAPQRYVEKAKDWISAATKTQATTSDKVNAAMALYAKRDFKHALLHLDSALAKDAKNARALALRAKIRLGTKEHELAAGDLKKLLGIGLNAPWIQEGLAFIAKVGGRPKDAASHLKKAIALSPQSGELYHMLIRLLDDLKDSKEAFAWRKKLTKIDQSNIKLVINLIANGTTQGASRDEILRWGEMGNHIAPFSVEFHMTFARALVELGLKDRARFEAESALLVEPTHAAALDLLKEL